MYTCSLQYHSVWLTGYLKCCPRMHLTHKCIWYRHMKPFWVHVTLFFKMCGLCTNNSVASIITRGFLYFLKHFGNWSLITSLVGNILPRMESLNSWWRNCIHVSTDLDIYEEAGNSTLNPGGAVQVLGESTEQTLCSWYWISCLAQVFSMEMIWVFRRTAPIVSLCLAEPRNCHSASTYSHTSVLLSCHQSFCKGGSVIV